jgi:DNA/RNA endonuclease YhcR with UshA esterase domain
MRGLKLVALAVPLMSLVMLAPALAGNSTAETPKYDVAKEVTIKGTVEEVKEVPNPKGQAGIHLMVKSGTEIVEVRLCPNSFLKEFEVVFNKGDELTITGSKVKAEDKEVILARVIESGNNKITLRDAKGVPVWTWLTKGGMK